MDVLENTERLRKRLRFCWGSLLLVPLAGLAVSGGPCGGPDGPLGAAILFAIGLASLGLAVYGVLGIRQKGQTDVANGWVVLSVSCAVLASLADAVFILLGGFALLSIIQSAIR